MLVLLLASCQQEQLPNLASPDFRASSNIISSSNGSERLLVRCRVVQAEKLGQRLSWDSWGVRGVC